MIVSTTELKKRINKRLNKINAKDLTFYIDTLIDIMRERIFNGIPIIIDNFGTISKKYKKPIKVMNVVTRKHIYIKPVSISLIPNIAFVKYIQEPNNLFFIKKKIIEASKKLIDKKTGKPKRII